MSARFHLEVFALLLAAVVALQAAGGNYGAEFGGHPDEAAHVVTGLMVRDYVAGGWLRQAPMDFAREYYGHYPKVALGNWPPLFYVLQAGWTLVFPPGTTSLLALMAVLTAAWATVFAAALRPLLGAAWAVAAALFLVVLPPVQEAAASVMTEVPVALFELLAVLALGRHLETGSWRSSLAFGLLASAAILTKGSGYALALVPPLAVAIGRRWALLRNPAFWASAGVVAALCLPWTALTAGLATAGWAQASPSVAFALDAAAYNLEKLALAAGVAVAVLALAGLLLEIRRPATGAPGSGTRHGLAALLVAVPLFHCLVPAGMEPRHLVPALPALVAFAVLAARRPPRRGVILFLVVVAVFAAAFLNPWIIVGLLLLRMAGRFPAVRRRALTCREATAAFLGRGSRGQRVATAGFSALALAVFFLQSASLYRKGTHGMAEVVAAALALAPGAERPLLISSDARGEGMFIARLALSEPRPGHRVQRASKALASSTWGGRDYQGRFEDTGALVEFIRGAGFAAVVVDPTLPDFKRLPHHGLLERAVATHPETFAPAGSFPATRGTVPHPEPVRLYRVIR